MASFNYRLNSLYAIKECSSCGDLYTADFCCSKGGIEDKIIVPKSPQNCATCRDPVEGLYCRPCAFVRKCLNEGWYTIHDKNEILNTYESFDDDTNVVNAPRESFVVKKEPGKNYSQSPPHIDHCCYGCGDSLDGIFCQQCTCKSCGKGAHIGYNCPPKAPIISNPEPCNQTIDELPQTLLSFDPTCYSGDENSFTYDSKPNYVDDSPNKEEERRIVEDQAAKDRYWKIPICYDDDEEYTIAITPVLSTKEPVDSLIMEDEHLSTSVENLVQIPSEFKGISEDTCDVPVCEDPSTFDALSNHYEILSDSNDDGTSSDDDSYENIEYIEASPLNLEYDSLEEVNEDQEEIEFDLEDILQIQDVILHEKFDSFFEESDISFSYSDNSLPEFETLSDHTEETRSGSTTTHANNSFPKYDSFLFEIEPNQGGLTGIVIFDTNPLLELPEFESFHFDLDPSFPRPPPEPPDVEISLIIETDAPVINNFDELNEDECFDPGGDEIDVEDDDSFTFVIQTFLPFLTYPKVSPLLSSTKNKDTIFDPGIST
ncbi:hypothetical protein Tco_0664923 [Tanacetum coccineum]